MKKFVSGVLLGAALVLPVGVFAGSSLRKIEAYIRNDFSISLDGRKVDLKNPVVIVEGNSYLPLKETAGLLGTEVNWNGNTSTIELGTTRLTVYEKYPGLKKLDNYIDSEVPALQYKSTIYLPVVEGLMKYGIAKNQPKYDPNTGILELYNLKEEFKEFTPGCNAFNLKGNLYMKEELFASIKQP